MHYYQEKNNSTALNSSLLIDFTLLSRIKTTIIYMLYADCTTFSWYQGWVKRIKNIVYAYDVFLQCILYKRKYKIICHMITF